MPRAPSRRCCLFRVGSLAVLWFVLVGIVGCWQRDPELDVSISEIDFGFDVDAVSFTVRNASEDQAITSGVVTLEYEIKADRAWMTIVPPSGRCGEGEQSKHVVTLDRTLLMIGNNLGKIEISSNGGSWTIDVRADRDAAACVDKPTVPLNLGPDDGATDVLLDAVMVWGDGVSRCPGLTATYDVYFGTTSPPPFDHNNGSEKTWDPGTLAGGKAYYWRIVARDANGTSSGAEWSFVTKGSCLAEPTVACNPSPANGQGNVSDNANLAWGCGDSQCGGAVANYDVYFGTNPTPGSEQFVGTTASKAWALPRLVKRTTYYWRIVSRDANGSSTGPVWSFTIKS